MKYVGPVVIDLTNGELNIFNRSICFLSIYISIITESFENEPNMIKNIYYDLEYSIFDYEV